MPEIAKRDRQLFWKEFFRFRLWAMLIISGLVATAEPVAGLIFAVFTVGLHAIFSHKSSKKKRFYSRTFEAMWEQVKDRRRRLSEALSQLRKEQIADLQELPRTVEALADSLYVALRRSDMLMEEIRVSEGFRLSEPASPPRISEDEQAKELFRIASQNRVRYKEELKGMFSGIERVEAQVAVFTSSLDALRAKSLNYRLTGKESAAPTQQFLEAVTEARMQFDSIDTALEELGASPFPETITIMPEEAPVQEQHERL